MLLVVANTCLTWLSLGAVPLPTPKTVPSNVSALPLVATLLPFRYSTPLAVPPFSVRLPDSVATPALNDAMDAPVTVMPVMTAVPRLAEAMLADVLVRFVTVPVVTNATAALADAMDADVEVRLVTVPVVITAVPRLTEATDAPVAVRLVTVAVVSSATPAFIDAMDAPVAVRLVITATPALMEAIEAAVN